VRHPISRKYQYLNDRRIDCLMPLHPFEFLCGPL
jgi:hypothetical protein